MPEGRNIIITGIPRSGTTLITALIDSMPDTVALNEPTWQYDWAVAHPDSAAVFADWLMRDFARTRQHLLKGEPIPERRREDGSAVTNYYRPDPDRPDLGHTFKVLPFTRPGLTSDFTLAIKHNGLYLGCLRQILDTGAFRAVAILRHPVGVIASWNNVPIPLGEGKMPGAMMYWPQMNKLTGAPIDLLEKQVRMYDLVCHRLHNLRDRLQIITYEELVNHPGWLTGITGKQPVIAEGMIKKRDMVFYNENTRPIVEAFKRFGQYYKLFYDIE